MLAGTVIAVNDGQRTPFEQSSHWGQQGVYVETAILYCSGAFRRDSALEMRRNAETDSVKVTTVNEDTDEPR
jgi:hypothetical protein